MMYKQESAERLRTVNNLVTDNIDVSIADCIRDNFYHISKKKPFLHTTSDKWIQLIYSTLTNSTI